MGNRQKSRPSLRFSEFTGEWEVRELRDLFKERAEWPTAELPLYSLTIESGIVPKTERYERSFLVKSEVDAYKVMHPNDFAFNPMNLRFGALARFKGNHQILVSKYYNIFYCTSKSDPTFCEHYLTSHNMIQFYNKMSSGSLDEKKRVHFLDFLKFRLRFPKLPEQQKIAAFLSAVDEKIGQLAGKKKLLLKYKKGLMQQIFDQKIRFKKDDGNDFPEWEEKKLGDIATFSKGSGISKEDTASNGLYECIRYGELYTHYGETIDKVVSRTNLHKSELTFSKENDVIIPSSGETNIDIARAASVLRKGIALGGDLTIIRSNLNGVFLSYYLNSKKKYDIARLAQGVSVVHLYPNHLAVLRIQIPSDGEQRLIADFLSAVDKKIALAIRQIEAMKTFKAALLQQMFV